MNESDPVQIRNDDLPPPVARYSRPRSPYYTAMGGLEAGKGYIVVPPSKAGYVKSKIDGWRKEWPDRVFESFTTTGDPAKDIPRGAIIIRRVK